MLYFYGKIMFKLMLVDDETLEREGLRDFIPWKELGVEVVGEASGGPQALEMATRLRPEIIITDIKMPDMSGLELASRLKPAMPLLKVIFVSGYQDFEYAKNAISLDAYGYVLKPVDDDELMNVVKKAVDSIIEERNSIQEKEALRGQIAESLPLLQQQFLRDVIFHINCRKEAELWERSSYLKLPFDTGVFCVAVVSIDDYKKYDDKFTQEDKEILNRYVLNMIGGNSIPGMVSMALQIKEALYAVIMNMKTDNIDGIDSFFRKFIDTLNDVYGMTATVGISETVINYSGIWTLYDQAMMAIKHKWYLGKGQIIFSSDLEDDVILKNASPELPDMENDIVQITLSGDIEGVNAAIREYFDGIPFDKKNSPGYVKNISLNLVAAIERALIERGENLNDILKENFRGFEDLLCLETITDVIMWVEKIFADVATYIREQHNDRNSLIVNKITKIINERYGQDITVDDISREIYLSPNYIRSIFKNKTGRTILDYLVYIRMKKASEMMNDASLHIYDVAKKVGYNSVSYFCQVFKQYYGVTPKEYMESMERS